MKPTDVLKREHKIVLAVLEGAESEAVQRESPSASFLYTVTRLA
jgi:hypothetical protein